MSTYYDLLGIQPTAEADEVKRAFRREIARYHPDKVQHLGTEFQEIAATRAAALTEAYRVLMDAGLRHQYDEAPPHQPAARPPASVEDAPAPVSPTFDEPASVPPADRRFLRDQESSTDLVRRAVTLRLKEVAGAAGGTVTSAPGFDLAFRISGHKGLFRKSEPTVTLVARIVPLVDAAAVDAAWAPVLRLAASNETLCLMLLGSGVAPARVLALAVSDLRKRTRRTGPIVVPVDVRDWEALFPPETPPVVRTLLDRLRRGD